MEAVHVELQVESDTIYLPQLRKFLGKRVEIRIVEQADQFTRIEVPSTVAAVAADVADPDVIEGCRELERDPPIRQF
jgi:hypothetical protein